MAKHSDEWPKTSTIGSLQFISESELPEEVPPPPLERLAQELDVDPEALRRYLRDAVDERSRRRIHGHGPDSIQGSSFEPQAGQ